MDKYESVKYSHNIITTESVLFLSVSYARDVSVLEGSWGLVYIVKRTRKNSAVLL